MLRTHISRPLVLLALALAAGGCKDSQRGSSATASAKAESCNLLLITLDTTRADRLGCYGWASAATPALDALARAGVKFDQAFSHVPITLPSHASLLTGTRPPENGIRDNGRYVLGP
ncbi:MAG: sulfatase-like hydrolase/transferase, partial [Opitutaceae bacterium]|nr:sulfatase-like hydrolase/transferase [Opitutaceae bacterium]